MSIFSDLHPKITKDFNQSVNIVDVGDIFNPYFFVGQQNRT